jgi:hypothetical protein
MDNVILLQGKMVEREVRPMIAGSTAEIVIFPGVRFERLTDEMVQTLSAKRSRRLPALQNHATAEELE